MDAIIGHLDSAKSVIGDAIARCGHSGTGQLDYPGYEPGYGNGSSVEPMPAPQDLPGGENPTPEIQEAPEPPKIAVTPEQSWTVEGGAFGGLEGLPVALSVGADGSLEITQMSDGSFQITNSGSGNVSAGIAGNGVEGGQGTAITYSVTAEELAYLKDQGLPIPDGVIPPGTDSSNVDANPFNNIQSIEVSSYAELALHDFDIPDGASAAAQDFFNADLPDGVSAAAGGEVGYEARQNQFGEWELVQKASVEGSYDLEVHEQDAGGFGGFINDFTPLEINDTTITGEKVNYQVEHVFNVETGQTEIRVIETQTTLNAQGGQLGIDIPLVPGSNLIPDAVPGSQYIPELEHTFSEGSSGTTTTVTTETVYDQSGNQISQNESSSSGTFIQSEGNLIVIGADVQATHEEYSD